MVKGFFENLKKFWRCKRNFESAKRKTLLPWMLIISSRILSNFENDNLVLLKKNIICYENKYFLN